MLSSEDYLTQHFPPRPNREGAKENADAYNTRIYWFKNNYPPYKKIAQAFGFKWGRVKNYADKYNWKLIRATYEEIVEKEELQQKKKEQKRIEKKIDTSNEITFNYLNKRREHLLFLLNELPNNPNNNKLNKADEREAREELRKVNEQLMKLQPLMRTNLHLTNNYTDRQINENYTKIDGDLSVTHNFKKSTLEVLKENEGEIGEFVKRAIKREN